MPWFRVDDTFSDHPKVDDLSLAAVGLWTLAGSWSARNLTDGHVTPARVRKFGGTPDEVTELVTAGLWIEDGNGWRFKSWDEYQPTKESVEKERAAARKRMQDLRSKKKNTAPTSESVPANNAEPAANEQRSDGGCSATPTLPSPTQPIPSKESTTKGRKRRLPPDWEPTAAHRKTCQANGYDLAYEANRFKTHAEAKDLMYVNWDAAFRNWLTNAKPRPHPVPTGSPIEGSWMIPRREAS